MALVSAIIQLSEQKNTSYTVYFIKVRSTTGLQWAVKKRYSDFVKFHNALLKTTNCKLPPNIKLPGKLWWKKLTGQLNIENALHSRRRDLQKYLDNILFSSMTRHSNEVKTFFNVDDNLFKGRYFSNESLNIEEKLDLIVETAEIKMLDSSMPAKYIDSRHVLQRKASWASLLTGFRRDSSTSDLGSTSISVSSLASPPRSQRNSLQQNNENLNELSFSRQSTIHSANSDMSNSFIFSESDKSELINDDEIGDKLSERIASTETYEGDSRKVFDRDSHSSDKRWSITETLRYYVSGSSAKSISQSSNGYQHSNLEYDVSIDEDIKEDKGIEVDLLLKFNHSNFQNASLCHHSSTEVIEIISSEVTIDEAQETALNSVSNILKHHISLNLEERFPIEEIKSQLPPIKKPGHHPSKFMVHI